MVEYSREYCPSCGAQIESLRRFSVSKSQYFCVKCAERLDKEYLIEHTCSVCKSVLSKNEHKMVMPSRIYGAEELPYVHRIMCMACYQKMGYRDRDTSAMSGRLQRLRTSIRKNIAKRQAERQTKGKRVIAA